MHHMKHSKSKSPQIIITTPTLNSEKYLEETILSVVTQRGEFTIHYHIQDGLSNDCTIQIIQKWEKILSDGKGFMGCAPVIFSWSSEKDFSMYDSINRGFNHVLKSVSNENTTLMTWINSDDRLTPGSMQTALSAHLSTGFDVITGLSSIITETGASAWTMRYMPLARENIRNGLHDGRTLCFIMQEGTYWSLNIWQKSGGLNTSMKLAGDWDLWRKLAIHGDWLGIHTALAQHRRHESQLSSNMNKYWAEIDASRPKDNRMHAVPIEETYGNEAYIDINTHQWVINQKNVSAHIPTSIRTNSADWSIDFSQASLPPHVQCLIGLSDAESWGRWSDARLHEQVLIKLNAKLPKNFTLHIKMSAYCGKQPTTTIHVKAGAQTHIIEATDKHTHYQLKFNNTVNCDIIAIRALTPTSPAEIGAGNDNRKLGVALISIEIKTSPQNP